MLSPPKKGFARSFIENYSLVMILNVAAMAVTFLSVAVLVRLMGVHELGLLLYARLLSTNGVWQLFDPGIRMRMSRAISVASSEGNDETVRMIFIAGIQAMTGIALVAVAIFILAKDTVISIILNDPASLERFAPVYVAAVVLWIAEFPTIALIGLLEGLRRFAIVKIIDLCQAILANFLMIVLAFGGYGFETLAYVYLGLAFFRFAILFVLTFKYLRLNPAKVLIVDAQAFGSLFSKTQHFFALTSLGQIYAQLEKLAFVVFLPPSFMVAVEIVSKLPQAIRAVTDNTRPVLINFASGLTKSADLVRQWQFMKISAQINVILCAGGSVFIAIVSTAIVDIWVGEAFVYLIPFLWLNLLYNIFLPPFGTLRDFLISQDQGMAMLLRYYLVQIIIRLTVLVTLFVIGIPLAFGLCLILGLVVTLPLFRYTKVKMSAGADGFGKAILRPYLAIMVASAGPLFLYLMPEISTLNSLIIAGGLYFPLFLFGLYITGTLHDLRKLKDIA
jgi:O-antigen/teichoic acid export membrane protein